jgi:hypothetical protein
MPSEIKKIVKLESANLWKAENREQFWGHNLEIKI